MSTFFEDHLPDLFIVPDFDNAKAVVSFTSPKGVPEFRWTVTSGDKRVKSGRIEGGAGKRSFEIPIKQFVPWTIDSPHLYALKLTWKKGSEAKTVIQNFGMRKFHVEGTQVFLNNSPLYIRGFIRGREAHDHPNLLGKSMTEYFEKNIRAAKAFGFNFVRFHSKVPPREFFDAADRMGILVHVEVRKYFGKYQAERDMLDHEPNLVNPSLWQESIKLIRNHASLMAYCLGNEINRPGRTPEVKERKAQLDKLDRTRLFIDTCARGEYDRTGVDFDVQHMGYFAPFGRNADMFNITDNWSIFGSVDDKKAMQTGEPGQVAKRAIPVLRPVLGHEVGHYVTLRDIDELKRKFGKSGVEAPWWLDELDKLRRLKGLQAEYPKMMAAANRYQFIWHKQVFESIRRSPILNGFNFLQLSDTDLYENCNGLVDCFDDFKPNVNPKDYLRFNADAVLVAELPRRALFEGEMLSVPVWLSNCSSSEAAEGDLSWSLKSKDGGSIDISGRIAKLDLSPGLSRIAKLELIVPGTGKAQSMELTLSLKSRSVKTENSWNLWAFPNRPESLSVSEASVSLADVDLRLRYPRLSLKPLKAGSSRLMIADRFSDEVFEHLGGGGDVLMLYRVPETRARASMGAGVEKETYYMPSTWDRFKPIIWDRGHNCGGYINEPETLGGFPSDGYIDFQFRGLIDDCDKLSLDDLPVDVQPIIAGVDKAARDRYDVFTYKLSELQPAWTQRKFAYLFDMRVGAGRLMMSAFNFTGLNSGMPEACGMFETLVAAVAKDSWKPKASIAVEDFRAWLGKMASAPRIKERGMTQYWQLDAEPLESAQFWKNAFQWIDMGW